VSGGSPPPRSTVSVRSIPALFAAMAMRMIRLTDEWIVHAPWRRTWVSAQRASVTASSNGTYVGIVTFAPAARAVAIAAYVAMRNRSGMSGPRSGRAENQCVASSPAAAWSSTPLSPPPGGRSDHDACGMPVIPWTWRTMMRPGSRAFRCSRSSCTRRPAPVLPPVVVE
jgi:hypothetical protein